MPFLKEIATSLSLGWMLLITGCETSPYLRDLKPAYDEHGQVDKDAYRINKAWMRHLLKDLKACYKEAD